MFMKSGLQLHSHMTPAGELEICVTRTYSNINKTEDRALTHVFQGKPLVTWSLSDKRLWNLPAICDGSFKLTDKEKWSKRSTIKASGRCLDFVKNSMSLHTCFRTFVKEFLEALGTLAQHRPDLLLQERPPSDLQGFCKRHVHLPCAGREMRTSDLHEINIISFV